MKTTEEKDFLECYSSKGIEQDINYNSRLIEMRYEPLEEQHILGVRLIVGNEPFASMYPPIQIGKRFDDTELQKELKKMRARRKDRDKLYKRIDVNVASDYGMCKFLSLILQGFDAITADLRSKGEAREVREYHEQKAKIEKVKKETPLFRITYQLDPLYELYEEGIAKVNVSGRGRRPELATNQFIKNLYEFLHPIFDKEYKLPEEKFNSNGKDIKNSVNYIQDIFNAFYGEHKDTGAVRKAISKK